MKLALLTGVAALSLAGAAGAQAETIYTSDSGYTSYSGVVPDPYVANGANVVATTGHQANPAQAHKITTSGKGYVKIWPK